MEKQVARCVALMAGNGAVLLFVFQYLYDFDRNVSPNFALVATALVASFGGLSCGFSALYFEARSRTTRILEAISAACFLGLFLGFMLLTRIWNWPSHM